MNTERFCHVSSLGHVPAYLRPAVAGTGNRAPTTEHPVFLASPAHVRRESRIVSRIVVEAEGLQK